MLIATSLEKVEVRGRKERILSARESVWWREGLVTSSVRSITSTEQLWEAVYAEREKEKRVQREKRGEKEVSEREREAYKKFTLLYTRVHTPKFGIDLITFFLTLVAGITASWLAMKRAVGPMEKMSSVMPHSFSRVLKPLENPCQITTSKLKLP